MLPIAIQSYLEQDWPDRELVVIDDGDPIEDMVRDIPGVQYHWFPADNLSQKRNFGIRAAKGDVIIHFDSDDWSNPNRISHQVSELTEKNLKIVGYSKAWWFDTRRKIATYASCGLWGASLCYDRAWALEYPWDETHTTCEDAWFLDPALKEGLVGEMAGGPNFVALSHNGNGQRPFGEAGWGIIENRFLPEGFRKFLQEARCTEPKQ